VNPNELMVYKMVLDVQEAILAKKLKDSQISIQELKQLHEVVVPAQSHLLKMLSKDQF
jgi:hypothetical protein